MKKALLIAAALVIALATASEITRPNLPALRYGWLVLGPDAKLKVLVAVQGENGPLFVDRDGDGAFRGSSERFPKREDLKDVTFKSADGKTTYTLTGWSHYEEKGHNGLMLNVDITEPASFKQYADVSLSRFRSVDNYAHFNGPLVVEVMKKDWKVPEDLALRRGDKPTDLFVTVGTLDADKRCWAVVKVHEYKGGTNICSFPDDVRPVVDIEFPARAAGGAPVKCQYVLKEFC